MAATQRRWGRLGLRSRNAAWWLLVGAGALAEVGCGPAYYHFNASPASSKLEQARALGAEALAPYEYFAAYERLEKAKQEAAEADYSDAATLADEAEQYAEKAIKLAMQARRGAGR